ncbi:MAG TPA: hypothetical protein VLA36_05905 [Longimicrobiales bacterium]|nr:hypothetical protein [Longimicrobiales bacterium]
MIRLLLFLLLAGSLVGYAFWVYTRAELPVPSGRRLAALRAATLVLLLALIFDPRLPWGDAAGSGVRWALVDVSRSMAAGGGGAWARARTRAQELDAEGWSVVMFGDGVSPGEADDEQPTATHSALAPAFLRAAEAGVEETRVISDLRFDDPVEAASVLASTGLRATFEGVGDTAVNAGVSTFSVSDQGRRGDPVSAVVELFAEGVADSLLLEVREEDRLVLSQVFPPPTPGRRGRWELELPAPLAEGRQRYTASVRIPGDGFADDDEAVAYMMAGHEEGALVVVSLLPDWEARALLPVLGEATGLPALGYLRVGANRFAPMGRAVERRPPVDSGTVRRAAADAALLVVHGVDGRTDAWGRSLVGRRGRTLAWPLDGAGADVAGVRAGVAQDGEWYAAAEVPASPLAGDLAGARLQDLPPLTSLLPLSSREALGTPLMVQLRGVGPGQPALVLQERGRDRKVVVLATGFWRWAARDGEGRDAYRRLWSGVAGWLLASDPRSAAPDVRPERWVTPRGEPVRWWIPGNGRDTVRLQILEDTSVVVDTLVVSAGSVETPVLPPGLYGFRAESSSASVGEGRFDVTARSDELFPLPAAPEVPAGAGVSQPAGPGESRPLRTLAWPYLLILALLFLEWVGRRRVGLR